MQVASVALDLYGSGTSRLLLSRLKGQDRTERLGLGGHELVNGLIDMAGAEGR